MKVCQKCYTEVEDHTRFCPNCGTQIIDEANGDDNGLIGRTLAGKFLIQKEIGSGAMGSIYKAEQINLGRTACIKVLHPHLMGDPTISKRFHREARAASRLKHPNCINVIDFGTTETDNIHYIAMDFLDGRDLSHVIRDEFPIEPLRVIHLADQICAALDEAHAAGVIHRDLKPENVFVEDRRQSKDFVTVLDFGIAKIKDRDGSAAETFATMAGMICGTPEYMSPEQGRGDTLDARSDLYAMGVILFHMNTGQLPFTGDTPIGIVTKHLTEPPPDIRTLNPTIHPDMADLIHRLLSKDKTLRPSSAMAVKREMERIRRIIEEDTEAHSATAPMARPTAEDYAAYAQQPSESTPPEAATHIQEEDEATQPASEWEIPLEEEEHEDTLMVAPRGAGRWVVLLLALASLGAGGWYLVTEVLNGETGADPADRTAVATEIPAADVSSERTPGESAPARLGADAQVVPADAVDVKTPPAADVASSSNVTAPPDAAPAPDAVVLPSDTTPEPDVVDPATEAREQARERIAALTGILQSDKNMLVARQNTLVKHEANWLAKETGEAIQAISDLETRVGLVQGELADGKIDLATETLVILKKDVKEAHSSNEALLARPIPSQEEVATYRKSEIRVGILGQDLDDAAKGLEEMKVALTAKQEAWKKAKRTERVQALGSELTAADALLVSHRSLRERLSPEQLDAAETDAAALAKERVAFEKRTGQLLKAKVRSRAEEAKAKAKADTKAKAKAKAKAEAEAETKAKAKAKAEAKAKAKADAEAKAAAKAKAEAEYKELVKAANAARSKGSYAAAIGLYKQALKRKDSTTLRERLGKAYNSTGQSGKAAEQFRICIKRLGGRMAKTTDEAQKNKLQEKIDLIKRQIRD